MGTQDLQDLFKRTMASLSGSSSNKFPLVSVTSSVDGRTYKVRDMPDKEEAANLMARVRAKIMRLYSYVSEKFPNKPQIKQLNKNFTPDPSRFEVHLCLRQREGNNEALVSENIMVFVSLHEMAHVITPSLGHGPDFWNNFAWLLKQAEEIKIYSYQDFKAHPVSYCGLNITDSPTYDPKKDGSDLSIGK